MAHTGEGLPVAALTNSLYRDSLRALGGGTPRAAASSLGRFATAARRLESFPAR